MWQLSERKMPMEQFEVFCLYFGFSTALPKIFTIFVFRDCATESSDQQAFYAKLETLTFRTAELPKNIHQNCFHMPCNYSFFFFFNVLCVL